MGFPVVNGGVLKMDLFQVLESMHAARYEGMESFTQTGIGEFTVRQKLGQGSFGVVVRVDSKDGNVSLARKQIDGNANSVKEWSKLLMRLQYGRTAAETFSVGEMWSFRKGDPVKNFVTCEKIVNEMRSMRQCLGWDKLHPILHWAPVPGGAMLDLYTPLCIGDLKDYVNANRSQMHMEGPTWKQLVGDLGSAVDYMHGMDVAHLDIKPENVLVKDLGGGSVCFLLSDYDFLWDLKSVRAPLDWGSPAYGTPSLAYNIDECRRAGAEGRKPHMRMVYLPGADVYTFAVTVLMSLYMPEYKKMAAEFSSSAREPILFHPSLQQSDLGGTCLLCISESDKYTARQQAAFHALLRWATSSQRSPQQRVVLQQPQVQRFGQQPQQRVVLQQPQQRFGQLQGQREQILC